MNGLAACMVQTASPFHCDVFAAEVRRLAAALGTVVAQLERSALGGFCLAYVFGGAAYLNLVEGAMLILVVGAAVDGALNAGIGLVKHVVFLLVF